MKKQKRNNEDNRGVAIYARKSRITNKGDSIGVQFKQCAEYALSLIHIYLLVWNNKYYLIGAEHKEFSADKMLDEDYYVLTLAAIARELNIAKIYSADVLIAAGLPLTWVSEQREEFKRYLLKHETVDFNFKGKDYHIHIVGADVYPQGFAAIVNHLSDFSGVNMLCDIGNGTICLLYTSRCV